MDRLNNDPLGINMSGQPQRDQQSNQIQAPIGDPLFSKALENGDDFITPKPQQQTQPAQNENDNWEIRAKYYQSEADKVKNELEQIRQETEGLETIKRDLESSPQLQQALIEYYNGGNRNHGQEPQAPPQTNQSSINPPKEFSPYEIADPNTESGRFFREMLSNSVNQAIQPQVQQLKQYVESQVTPVQQTLTQQQQMQSIKNELNLPDQDFNKFVQWATNKQPTSQDLFKLYQIQNNQAAYPQQAQPQGHDYVPNLTGYQSQERTTDDNDAAKRMVDSIIQAGNNSIF